MGSGTSHQGLCAHMEIERETHHDCVPVCWFAEQNHLLPGQYYCRAVTHGWQAPFDGLQWPDTGKFTVSVLRPQHTP